MKKFLLSTVLVTLAIILFTANMNAQNMNPTAEAVENLKAYPETMDGLERHVIYVEKKGNESSYMVEIVAGKTMQVDCNQHGLAGSFKEDVVTGWGYPYYRFKTNGNVFSTQMACLDGTTKEAFVQGEGLQVRYNSRLPLVVYLPQGIDLKYRIWSAGELLSVEE